MTDPTETITLTEFREGDVATVAHDLRDLWDVNNINAARFDGMRLEFERMQDHIAQMVHDLWVEGAVTLGTDRTADPVRLAGCTIGREVPTGITVAVAAVASTILALEYLRRRKQLVAAEDPQSVIADFVAWFERWIAGLREMFGRSET